MKNYNLKRTKDIIILLIGFIIILYFTFNYKQSINLKPSFFIEIDPILYRNHKYPSFGEDLPKPIIEDIDGDGLNEIIISTREPKLKIYKLNSETQKCLDKIHGSLEYKNFCEIKPIKEVSLLSKTKSIAFSKGRNPIATQIGFIEEGKQSSLIIIVVTESWNIICLDRNLNIIWETSPTLNLQTKYYHSEISILITHHKLYKDDIGMIIIGGKMKTKQNQDESNNNNKNNDNDNNDDDDYFNGKESYSKENQHKYSESIGDLLDLIDYNDIDNYNDNQNEKKPKKIKNAKNFCYYALEGRTGDLRWSQEIVDSDYNEFNFVDEIFQNIKGFKNFDQSNNPKNINWRKFRQSFINCLPHKWESRDDTKFEVKHFAEDRHTQTMKKRENLLMDTKSPNVFVSHTENGIYVMNLYTGQIITQMALENDGVYADINNDNAIEHVFTLDNKNPKQSQKQYAYQNGFSTNANIDNRISQFDAVSTTGFPLTDLLWKEKLPISDDYIEYSNNPEDLLKPNGNEVKKSQEVFPLNPLLIQPIGKTRSTPVIESKNGEDDIDIFGIQEQNAMHDSIFALNTGEVFSYDSYGFLNWKQNTESIWLSSKFTKEKSKDFISYSKPLISGFSHEILFIGADKMSILSAKNGKILSTYSIPDFQNSPFSGRIIQGDFNNDGLVDLILETRTGYLGFSQPKSSVFIYQNFFRFLFVLFAVLVVIILLCFSSRSFSKYEIYGGRKSKRLIPKKKKMKESTRFHL
ncbi:fg-gap repeat-containing protein [Anaeramoeba ignava]|uniref:Fg-gap repeat-containing protein n=1 Tax=Anaeramoeba ignava TaxID=1746090 RepID=A0A9Q0LD37_ANAIG|nr:fg-gap repeat-containing protein [Anaeramoeba ignava]